MIEAYNTFESRLKEEMRLIKVRTHAADTNTTRQAYAAGRTPHGCLAKWERNPRRREEMSQTVTQPIRTHDRISDNTIMTTYYSSLSF